MPKCLAGPVRRTRGYADSNTVLFDRSMDVHTHCDSLVSYLTSLDNLPLQDNQGVLAAPLIAAAGQDISHWWGEK